MKVFFPLLAVLLLGCPATPAPLPPPHPFEPGTCAEWCAHALELRCDVGKPTPNGASCTTVCEHSENVGISHFNLGCRTKSPSCTAADSCEK